MTRSLAALSLACLLTVAVAVATYAQVGTPTIPSWVGNLVMGLDPLAGADPASPTVTDALGFKFELFFTAQDDSDPKNPTNQVISMEPTNTGAIGVAIRKLNPGVKIDTLTDQLQLKYLFPTRSCGGGSPRFQLAIDTDGDGTSNGNAFGYVGHGPFGTGCLTAVWDIIDMTDNVGRWDLSQFGGGMTMTWDLAVLFVNSAFPNHQVLRGSLVDDSATFSPPATGKAFYDLVTIGHRTLENWQDTVH